MGQVNTLMVVLALCLTDRAESMPPIFCSFPDEYKHHPTDCNRFVHCALGIPYVKECPLDLVFSDIMKICVPKNSLHDDCTPRCCGDCNHGNCDHGGSGGYNSGGNNPGGNNPGGNNPGGSGGSNPDGNNPGGSGNSYSGGNNPGGSNPGGNNPGGSGGSNPCGNNPGGSGGSNPGGNNPGGSGDSNPDSSNPGGSGGFTPSCPDSSGSSNSGGSNPGGSNPGGNSASDTGPSSRQGQIVRVLGDLSAPADNARSTARCPSGSIVLNCVCDKRTGCNGHIISGRNCRVFNARGGPGQKAIGICFFDNADNWEVVNSRLTSSPEAICNSGFKVYACTIHNRNSHRETVAGLLDRGRNSCRTASSCRIGRGCRTQAICRKK